MDLFECECCDLRLCKEKRPGIGYYCDECMGHYVEYEDFGRMPSAVGPSETYEAMLERHAADHKRMAEPFRKSEV